MVRKPTKGQKQLDIFLTNCPHLWSRLKVIDGVVKSDHLAVVITPRVAVKPEKNPVYFREARDHRKFAIMSELETQDWSFIDDCKNVNESVIILLNHVITSAFNNCFSLIEVARMIHTRSPVHVSFGKTPMLLKYAIKVRGKELEKIYKER